MSLEVERRFLVRNMPVLSAGRRLKQGYLALTAKRDIRIRDDGGCFSLCVKEGGGLSRSEVEVMLAEQDFSRLWLLTEGARLEKVRYPLAPLPGTVATCVDRYSVPACFDLVEVEFDSEEAALQFSPPAWFGDDVTALATPSRLSELIGWLSTHYSPLR